MARKSELLYVKSMNLSESEEEDEGDVWDDRKLNEAYDKALKVANAEVAKRIAMSTNNQSQNKEGQPSNKKEKPANKTNPKGRKKGPLQWAAGMPCRAVYEADGMEYEAFVLRVINKDECVVRFLGYENSEIVSINSLKPTRGTKERTRQIEQALEDKTDEAYRSQSPNVENMDVTDRMSSSGSTDKAFHKAKKSTKKKKAPKERSSFELPNMPFQFPPMVGLNDLGSMEMPLPPPPPALGRSDSEDQAVTSMLLSWYMSGYYTGLYQGLKRAKEDRRNM